MFIFSSYRFGVKMQRGAKTQKLQSWWFGNTPYFKIVLWETNTYFCPHILKIDGIIYINQIRSCIVHFVSKKENYSFILQMISEILKDWPSMHGKSLLCKLALKQLVVTGDKMLASGQDSWNHSLFLRHSLAIPMERNPFSWAFLAKLFCIN